LLHLLNVFLVFVFAHTLLGFHAAWVAASLFGLHPICSSPIHYVSARADSLCTFFLLSGLVLFARKQTGEFWAWGAMVFFLLLSFLSKEMSLLFPFIFLVLIFFGTNIQRKKSLACWFISVVVLFCIYFSLRGYALGSLKAVGGSLHASKMMMNYPPLVGDFIRLFFYPKQTMPLSSFEILDVIPGHFLWGQLLLQYGILILMSGLLIRLSWIYGLGFIWVLLSLAPPTVAVVRTKILDGHYFYCASIGASLMMATFVSSFLRNPRFRVYGTCIVSLAIIGLAYQSFDVGKSYRTEISFYEAIRHGGKHPSLVEYNLGNAYNRRGMWGSSLPLYEEVLHQNPRHMSAKNNLALAYLNTENMEQAYTLMSEVIREEPFQARYQYNWSLILEAKGEKRKADQALLESLRLDPLYLSAKQMLYQRCGEPGRVGLLVSCRKLKKL